MFDKNGMLDIIKIIKEEYNYDFTTYKDLLKQDFIEVEGNGVDALFWLKYQGDKYLFKPVNNATYNVWGEILSQRVAEDLNLSCAKYRIAFFKDQIGVLSKSFLKSDEKLIMGSELIQEYLRHDYDVEIKHRIDNLLKNTFFNHYDKMKLILKDMNNYTDVTKVINVNKKLTIEEKENITSNMKDRLFFDILTMQGDDHTNNWGIIKTKDGYKNAPLYDNTTSFGLNHPRVEYLISDFKEEYINYRFHQDIERLRHYTDPHPLFTYHERKENISSLQVLQEFLDNLSDEEIERYYNIINRYSIDYLDDLIMDVEEKNGYNMDNELRFYILNLFEINLNDLKETFRKKVVKSERTK